MKKRNFYTMTFMLTMMFFLVANSVSSQNPISRVNSMTRSYVAPSMTDSQRAALSHVAGNLVWQTDGVAGYYYDNGSTWMPINSTPTYTIGLHLELGGYVFDLTSDGKHGMVAETQDLNTLTNWYEAPDKISIPANHTSFGQKFRDWRMPTRYELDELYTQRVAIGGFIEGLYLSSTESNYNDHVWCQNFGNGIQDKSGYKYSNQWSIRCVRTF